MKFAIPLLLTISIASFSADVVVGSPESSGCAPIGIG
jgi:hypothetical protein